VILVLQNGFSRDTGMSKHQMNIGIVSASIWPKYGMHYSMKMQKKGDKRKDLEHLAKGFA
jgi:hypothetical protein